MKICDKSNHGEIVHEERWCPACQRIEGLEQEVLSLKEQLDEALKEG